ncbi:hypothetical protein K432DRAFT_227441 [Lepidopterella palustris CBS 459.81]|uniref:Uncharacterized protein n=1 Tax=Lepidopterella palustris CBS 459.81 TaxID=1314670 RepID=A0A8E2DXR9_9PEZI|nr:hypothetical protein K432DRAFT_227441 [Lepidopterella palustris CBS 459.81]
MQYPVLRYMAEDTLETFTSTIISWPNVPKQPGNFATNKCSGYAASRLEPLLRSGHGIIQVPVAQHHGRPRSPAHAHSSPGADDHQRIDASSAFPAPSSPIVQTICRLTCTLILTLPGVFQTTHNFTQPYLMLSYAERGHVSLLPSNLSVSPRPASRPVGRGGVEEQQTPQQREP